MRYLEILTAIVVFGLGSASIGMAQEENAQKPRAPATAVGGAQANAWTCPWGGPGLGYGRGAGWGAGVGRGAGRGWGWGAGWGGSGGGGRGLGPGGGQGKAPGGPAFVDRDGNGVCDRYEWRHGKTQ